MDIKKIKEESNNLRKKAEELWLQAEEAEQSEFEEKTAIAIKKIKEDGLFAKCKWLVEHHGFSLRPCDSSRRFYKPNVSLIPEAIELLNDSVGSNGIWVVDGGFEYLPSKRMTDPLKYVGNGYKLHLNDSLFHASFPDVEVMRRFVKNFNLEVDISLIEDRIKELNSELAGLKSFLHLLEN